METDFENIHVRLGALQINGHMSQETITKTILELEDIVKLLEQERDKIDDDNSESRTTILTLIDQSNALKGHLEKQSEAMKRLHDFQSDSEDDESLLSRKEISNLLILCSKAYHDKKIDSSQRSQLKNDIVRRKSYLRRCAEGGDISNLVAIVASSQIP